MKKEEAVLELFFNEPTKHWHFEEILKEAKISRPQASRWLNKMKQEGVVQRIKERRNFPYYQGNYQNASYRYRKKLFTLGILYASGFLNHLFSLEKARTVILFGSIMRSDWHKESDIDIFIYGEDDDFEQGKYEGILGREIQVFVAKNKKDLERMGVLLLENIIKGYIVKGNLDFLEVHIRAKRKDK